LTPSTRLFVSLAWGPLLAALAPSAASAATCAADPGGDPVVELQTTLGALCLRLRPADAPKTVANFLAYVGRGDYDGTLVHRSVPGFVIQGGGYRYDPLQTDPYASIPRDPPVVNEPGVSNTRGTVAMARLPDESISATSEWFVNLVDNTGLDTQNGGFTVFADVVQDTMGVADGIAALPRLGYEARLLRSLLRNLFLEAPLQSALPGPSGTDCFDPASVGALVNAARTALEVDPVSGGPVFVSPACLGVAASGTCGDPNRDSALYELVNQQAFAVFTGWTCDEIEASDRSLAMRRERVAERQVEVVRAFVVPEPRPDALALAAWAALVGLRRYPGRRCARSSSTTASRASR
jgi:cyclophilin family peptidyl-prolyl cis-trans isomerase